MLRKLRKKELKMAVKNLANFFMSYPLYDTFFKNVKIKKKGLFCFSYLRLYTRLSYTYVSDDLKTIVVIKKPNDKELPMIVPLLKSPYIFFKSLFSIHLYTLKTLSKFSKFEDQIHKNYYDPKTDYYLQMLAIDEEKRKTEEGSFDNLIKNFLVPFVGDNLLYFETHSKQLETLYELKAAKLVNTSSFMGIDQFAMKWDLKSAKKLEFYN